MGEAQYLNAPLRLTGVDADAGTIELESRLHFRDGGWLAGRWELADDGAMDRGSTSSSSDSMSAT